MISMIDDNDDYSLLHYFGDVKLVFDLPPAM